MSGPTEVPASSPINMKSKRMIFVVIAIILTAIALLSVLLLANRSAPWAGHNQSEIAVTMVDLQMDYDMWKGEFKSYDENDTLVFRDTITSIEFDYNPYGYPITALYFKAHALPSLDDLESGRVRNESWYTWRSATWDNPVGEVKTMFQMRYDDFANEYLPEARINVQGDVQDSFRVGDTVKMTLHVWKAFYRARLVESIFEFSYSIKPENIEKTG
jgi:hypothetical protein